MLPEEIKKNCEAFREQNDEFEKYHKPAVICGIIFGIMIFVFLYVVAELPSDALYQIELSYVVGFITLGVLIAGIILAVKGRRYKLDSSSLAAMYGYNAFQLIQEYKEGAKLPSKLKRVKKDLKEMQYEITQTWSEILESDNVIASHIEPVKTFVERVKKIPAVVDKESDLTLFQQILLDLIDFVLDKKNQNFESLNKKLEKSIVTPVQEVKESEPILKKYPVIKFAWIPIIVGVGLFVLLDYLDPQSKQTSVGWAFSISVAILLSILFRKSIKIRE